MNLGSCRPSGPKRSPRSLIVKKQLNSSKTNLSFFRATGMLSTMVHATHRPEPTTVPKHALDPHFGPLDRIDTLISLLRQEIVRRVSEESSSPPKTLPDDSNNLSRASLVAC